MKLSAFLLLIISLNAVQSWKSVEYEDDEFSTTVLYHAFIRNNENEVFCGAAIVSKYWLVSAAHCFTSSFETMSIVTGTNYLNGYGGTINSIDRVIIHPNFNFTTRDNDISLVKVKQKIEFNERVEPIYVIYRAPISGERMTISGFGKESEGASPSPILQKDKIRVLNNNICALRSTAVAEKLSPSMFCAGRDPDSVCRGLPGAPGVIADMLGGIVTATYDCNSPGIYTRVDIFEKWIYQHIET